MPEPTDEINKVLAEHQIAHHGTTIAGFNPCRCSCGLDFACPVFQSWEFCEHYHRAHLAATLADLLAARDRRVRAEALREAADDLASLRAFPWTVLRLRERADRIEAP